MPTLLTCRGLGSLSGQKKKRKEKRFAQNWRIFRSNYAKRDNLNMPRIWREFSGNFLYWQNLRWQKIWFVVNYSTSSISIQKSKHITKQYICTKGSWKSFTCLSDWVTILGKKLMYVQKKYILLSAAEQEIFYSKDKIWILRKAYPFGLLLKNVSILVKFIYSEKATIFCEISTVDLTTTTYIGQIYGGDFTKLCGLLRIYELYVRNWLFSEWVF